MRVEYRAKEIHYGVFIAIDGTEFENQNDCLEYESKIKCNYKLCPVCKGKGTVEEKEVWENYHTGADEHFVYDVKCKKCEGIGYIKKKRGFLNFNFMKS